MRKKVVVFSHIDSEVVEKLKEKFQVSVINPKLGNVDQQIIDEVSDADGLIGAGRLLNESNLFSATRLKVISSVSVGYDNYDLNYLNREKILLCNTQHVLTESTADLAFTLLMSAARKVPSLDQWVKNGEWKRTIGPEEFGQDIHGKTLGIIGLGHIGAAIARRGFYGFNMNVLYHNRKPKPEIAQSLSAQYCSLSDLLQCSDFVVVVVDSNAESQALIGEKEFDLMQKHAIIVNISRGAVIDENALIQALKNKKIFAAGLDVYQTEPLQSSELFHLDNVVTLPHVGSATKSTRKKMAELAYQNLVDVLEDRQPQYAVNRNFSN